MKSRILKECLKIAHNDIDTHPEHEYYPHWSFAIQNNKIIGKGYNRRDFPEGNPLYPGYARRVAWNNGLPKMHSEVSLWTKVKGIIDGRIPWSVVNIRLNRQGEIRSSCPCPVCKGFLTSLGCSKVYFTTDAGWAQLKD